MDGETAALLTEMAFRAWWETLTELPEKMREDGKVRGLCEAAFVAGTSNGVEIMRTGKGE